MKQLKWLKAKLSFAYRWGGLKTLAEVFLWPLRSHFLYYRFRWWVLCLRKAFSRLWRILLHPPKDYGEFKNLMES